MEYEITQSFEDYLMLMRLDPNSMPPAQLRETRRAFYGGCGKMIRMIQAAISDGKLEETLVDLEDQVGIFWVDETKAHEQEFFDESESSSPD